MAGFQYGGHRPVDRFLGCLWGRRGGRGAAVPYRVLRLEPLEQRTLLDTAGVWDEGVSRDGPPAGPTGSVVTQGDAALQADVVRQSAGLSGAGVRIGVLADSVNRVGGGVSASQASGDLPAEVIVLRDGPATGVTDQGRGMLEVIHDLAPGAALVFRSAAWGELDVARAIHELVDAGCDVIVDGASYWTEPVLADGPIAQAIDHAVNAHGVAYFSAAGDAGPEGYAAVFRDSQPAEWDTAVNYAAGRNLHDFDPGPGTDVTLRVEVLVPARLALQWDQPWYTPGQPVSNFDLYAFDLAGNLVAASLNDNAVAGMPRESMVLEPGTYELQINHLSGPEAAHLKLWAAQGAVSFGEYAQESPGGTITGHAAAERAATVAAAPYAGYAAGQIEPSSARGPATVYLDTAYDRLVRPQTRAKPELTAPDGGNTTFFGADDGDADTWPNFYGTSAAAAHAAGVAALLLQQRPDLSPQQVYQVLADTAADRGPPGWDPTYGAGTIDAFAASAALADPANYADTLGPRATEFSVPERSAGNVDRLTVWFNERLDPASAEEVANYELRASGPDGRFGTADDVLLPLATSYDPHTRSVSMVPAEVLGPGAYRLTLRSGGQGLRDVAGNPLAEGYDQNHTFVIGGLEGEVALARQAYLASWPDVAINSAGQRVAVWAESTGDQGSARVLVQAYAATGRPLGPFPLELAAVSLNRPAESNRSTVLPAVAVAEDGRFVVAYEGSALDSLGRPYRAIFVQRFHADGTLLGEPILADTGWPASPADQAAPDVAIRPDGAQFVVVWEEGGAADSSRSIQAVAYTWEGTAATTVLPINATAIASSTTPWMIEPAVAMNASGQFAVAWARLASGTYTTYVRRFDAAGVPATAEIAVGSGGSSGNHGWTPDVAIDDQGNFVVAFGNADTWIARYNATGQLRETAFRANTTTAGSQMDPALALNPQSGDFLIVWRSTGQDGPASQGVFARMYDAAARPLTDEFQINQTTAYHESYPAAAMNRQGDAWVAWQAFETAPNRAWAVYGRWIPASASPGQAKVVVQALEVPTPLTIGESFDVRATLYNPGLDDTGSLEVSLYLSDDPEVSADDLPISLPASVPAIGPGMSWTSWFSASLGAGIRPGTRYVGLVATPGTGMAGFDQGNFDQASAIAVQPVAVVGPLLGLEAERVVNTTTAGDQRRPQVAMDDAGQAVVVWWGNGPEDASGVFFQRFGSDGLPQGPETRANVTISGTQTAASVAMNRSTGDFVVAWASDHAGTWDIYFRRFDALGNPQSGETLAHASTAGTQDQPAVAMDDAGRFVLAWCSGSTPKVVVQRFDADGNRLGGPIEAETTSYPGTSSPQSGPAVAINGPGEFVVAWQSAMEDDAPNHGVYFQRFDPSGNRRGTQTLAHLRNASEQAAAALGLADDGTLVIAWHSLGQEQQGTALAADRGVYFQRFDNQNFLLSAGAAASFPPSDVQANAYVISDQDQPALAVLRNGAWIIAWQSLDQDGSANGVYFRRYRPDGSPDGGVWQANTTLADSQQYPAVAATAQSFALVWESRLQDGSGWGLVARRWTQVELDFGDAPAGYPTLLADDGPHHVLVPGLYLGSAVDSEADGQPAPAADGDDLTAADDEDGVVFTTPLVPGRVMAEAVVTASAAGRLDAWIDWNADGDFDDPGEPIAQSLPLAPGANPLLFDVPAFAEMAPRTVARFRFSSAGGLRPTGVALDGEVEDYVVPLVPPPSIDVGTHLLVAGEPDQSIPIRASGGLLVDGMNFRIQIGDGSGQVPSPAFTPPLDLMTGTIFEGKNTGQLDTTIQPQWASARIETTPGQTVPADGLIATVTVSTVGIAPGTWPLIMSSTVLGPADFLTLPADITDGQIVVKHRPQAVLHPADPTVPENGSVWLDAAGSFDPDPGDTIVGYQWDLDDDGIFETLGPQALFSAAGRDGPSSQTIRLRVMDNDGLYSTVAVTQVAILNVPPTLAVSGAGVAEEGSVWTVELGEVSDPGSDTPSRWVVHWGDGSQEEFFTPGPKTHVYQDGPAEHTVTVDVEDEDGLHLAAGSTQVSIGNTAPWAVIRPPAGVDESSPAWIATAEVHDISPADSAAGLRYAWDFGNDETWDLGGPTYGEATAQSLVEVPALLVADGPAVVPVLVRVIDKDDGWREYLTEVVVRNLAPQAEPGGPYRLEEAGSIRLGAAGTDPAGPLDPLTFLWDLDGDGQFGEQGLAATRGDERGPRPQFHARGLHGPRNITVALMASDDEGATSTVRTTNVLVEPDQNTIGLFNPASGAFYLKNSNSATGSDVTAIEFHTNMATYQALVGDWDGDGIDTIGVFVPATGAFYLKNSNTAAAGDVTAIEFHTTMMGYQALVGDWDGDGMDTIGVFVPATGAFYLKHSNTSTGSDVTAVAFRTTMTGFRAVTGDWNRDGSDTIGVFVPGSGAFYLKDSNTPAGSDVVAVSFRSNMAGWQPLVGDWRGPARPEDEMAAAQPDLSAGAVAETARTHVAETPLPAWPPRPGFNQPRLPHAQADNWIRYSAFAAAMPGSTGQARSTDRQHNGLQPQAVDVVLARLHRLAELGQ